MVLISQILNKRFWEIKFLYWVNLKKTPKCLLWLIYLFTSSPIKLEPADECFSFQHIITTLLLLLFVTAFLIELELRTCMHSTRKIPLQLSTTPQDCKYRQVWQLPFVDLAALTYPHSTLSIMRPNYSVSSMSNFYPPQILLAWYETTTQQGCARDWPGLSYLIICPFYC